MPASPTPAWVLVRWEDSFLLKRFLQKLWDILAENDRSAERIVLHPKDAASAKNLFQEISSPSLFSSTRLIVAHVPRPVHRIVPMESLARQISVMPDQTTIVLAVEGMSPLADETKALADPAGVGAADPAAVAGGRTRTGMNVAVWRPFDRLQLLDVAREILSVLRVHADDLTLNFWLDRIGSNLERLQSEAHRLTMQFSDGEATQERLEEIFEVPHVHDETVWNIMRAMLNGEPGIAATDLTALLQSSDVSVVASELSRSLLCANALAMSPGTSPNEIFLRFDVGGKRRQKKMTELASRISNTGRVSRSAAPSAGVSGSAALRPQVPASPTPADAGRVSASGAPSAGVSDAGRGIPHLAGRLLALDLAIKQAKTAAGRQEVLLRSLLSLCGEPEPAA